MSWHCLAGAESAPALPLPTEAAGLGAHLRPANRRALDGELHCPVGPIAVPKPEELATVGLDLQTDGMLLGIASMDGLPGPSARPLVYNSRISAQIVRGELYLRTRVKHSGAGL